MTDERIDELLRFKTKDFTDCPVLTEEQLKEFKPRYANLLPLDSDVLEWLKRSSEDGDYPWKANALLRNAMTAALTPPTP
ncbi:MAG: hypothetical protein LBG76_10285 [Treponema sp.]|jgi:uncharacterized protein (DUF4415 family)|nr:hypothetical protein [Treponema sp.]